MLEIDHTIISLDVLSEQFVCNLDKCKGLCCLYGDAGAPIEEDELSELEDNYLNFKSYMTSEGIESVDKLGLFEVDQNGDLVTPLIENRECAYALVENALYSFSIEKAFFDGKSTFRKPISCHLYPIRVKKYEHFDGVNYDRWDICKSGCRLGKELAVPVYKFLKEPLIRKYGEDWYVQLSFAAENLEANLKIR